MRRRLFPSPVGTHRLSDPTRKDVMQAPHGLDPVPMAGNPTVETTVPVDRSRRFMTAGVSDPFGCASTQTDPKPTPIAIGPLS
jgi:hypothetical protein